jgi:hypothetical protein
MLMKYQKIIGNCSIIIWLSFTGCTAAGPRQDCQVLDPKLQGHYSGECQNGQAFGTGEAVGVDKYEGQFAQGLPDGSGTYTWADGESFKGEFRQGEPQIPHQGCYVADYRLRGNYQGACNNGKAFGRGKSEGIDTYEGEFVNGMLEGQGTYVWANGDRYIGKFKGGLPHGRGMMKYITGEEEAGPWEYGKSTK